MTLFALRIFIFFVMPLLLAGMLLLLDRTAASRARQLEVLLIFLFMLAVGGSGLGNFFAHYFLSDQVAQLIGWPPDSPFQLEVAFANLALGVLGFGAVGRRDGFREATVIAVTVFSVGATVVHLMDIVATGNLAPGNTLQNVLNLARPALLITLLMLARRQERSPAAESRTVEFEQWRAPVAEAAGLATACVATGFGIGFAVDAPVAITLLASALSAVVVYVIVNRSPLHDLRG